MKARPEYGKQSTPARQDQRRRNICSTAMVIYGVIGAMSDMFVNHVDPEVAFKALAVAGGEDVFSWDNPEWAEAGVVTPRSKGGALTTGNSFQSRRAATRVLRDLMGLTPDQPEEE